MAIAKFQPQAFVLENVMGFSRKLVEEDHTPLEDFLSQISSLATYHTKAFTAHLSDWVTAGHDRHSNLC